MQIESVQLKHFRNFNYLNIDFNKKANVLKGKNGQGKTNLLESLYLLTKSSSFRPSDNEALILKEKPKLEREQNYSRSALISGQFLSKGLKYDIKLQVLPKSKRLQLNGKAITFQQMSLNFPAILFSPESLSIIKSGPDVRRELIDDYLTMLDSGNKRLIMDYKKVLKNKSRILKDFRLGNANYSETLLLIQSLNQLFIPLALKLTHTRILALKRIQNVWRKTLGDLFGDNSVDSCIEYLISSQSVIDWTEDRVYGLMQNRIEELTSAEINAGSVLSGPHKHDLSFRFKGEEARFFCSQGQQRLFVLAFKIAQSIQIYSLHNQYPVLFLDDVFSELDTDKRENLMSYIKEVGAQVFMTTTEIMHDNCIDEMDYTSFCIDNGKIIRC